MTRAGRRQPVDLLGGVVVRQADPQHPAALFDPQALGEVERVVFC